MSELLQRQFAFAQDVALLIQKANTLGYHVTLGETWRPPEMVAIYAARDTGSGTSVHPLKLAIDLNLFIGTTYITDSAGHIPLGYWWKTLSPLHRWGGDFPKHDYNHYSITPDGIRA